MLLQILVHFNQKLRKCATAKRLMSQPENAVKVFPWFAKIIFLFRSVFDKCVMHDEVECALSPTHWSQKFYEVKFGHTYKICSPNLGTDIESCDY